MSSVESANLGNGERRLGPRWVIAGGGTGGHLFPGIAVAGELKSRFEEAEVLFVVGRKRMESEILSGHGYQTASIDVKGLKGSGWKKEISTLIKLPKSLLQSAWIIRRFSPGLVLGVGGYSSGPFCLVAKVMGIPTAIHEQNSYPGLTNRLLARFVDRIFISFEESGQFFRGKTPMVTGNPIRRELLSYGVIESEMQDVFTILVVGGSQGARAINEAFVEALSYLNIKGKRPHVIHQTGEGDYERVVKNYRSSGLDGEVLPFIRDMAKAYHRADIVVSRAGATTISELAALGKPSILIPYPYAADQHQDKNALSLVHTGGAKMILQRDLTGEGMARVLMGYMEDRGALKEMGKRVRAAGRTDSARVMVNQLLDMAHGTRPPGSVLA